MIKIIHCILIIFIVFGVFSDNKTINNTHTALLFSILAHWILNDNSCFLTQIEKKITNTEDDQSTFIYKVISPFYKIDDSYIGKIVHLITLVLFGISVYKLK